MRHYANAHCDCSTVVYYSYGSWNDISSSGRRQPQGVSADDFHIFCGAMPVLCNVHGWFDIKASTDSYTGLLYCYPGAVSLVWCCALEHHWTPIAESWEWRTWLCSLQLEQLCPFPSGNMHKHLSSSQCQR